MFRRLFKQENAVSSAGSAFQISDFRFQNEPPHVGCYGSGFNARNLSGRLHRCNLLLHMRQKLVVTAEPLVVDPIAMAFDENGRLFVVEMRDYPERRNEMPHLGRIRMLEDTDGDGRFDKSTVYADNLPWPTAVICWNGGVFVGATPDILYCKDTNGDGVADVREVVFTGIASNYAPYDVNKLNVQALFNGFMWGLDNRIHAANGGDGGTVHLVDSEFTRAWQGRAGMTPK